MAKNKVGAAALFNKLAQGQDNGIKRSINFSLPTKYVDGFETIKKITGRNTSEILLEVLEDYGFLDGVRALESSHKKSIEPAHKDSPQSPTFSTEKA